MQSINEIIAENKTKTATITIGRNVGKYQWSDKIWSFFQSDLHAIAEKLGTVYFIGSSSTGSWKGVKEDNCTVVFSLIAGNIPRLERRLTALKQTYKQDAIALTIGTTVMI